MDSHKIDLFLHLFFHKLEMILNKPVNLTELRNLKLHRDEANTDDQLKKFIKDSIHKNKDSIIGSMANNQIIYDDELTLFTDDLNFNVDQVYLPQELTAEMINAVKVEGRTFTNPDLLIKVSDTNNEYKYIPLELKSTKTNSIPGSSVQQIDGDEWVIFVKITTTKTEVIIGKYLWAINQKMQFPDRSPRPNVSFDTMSDWKKSNETYGNDTLTIILPEQDISERNEVINNWQQVLVERWIEEVKRKKISVGWFNSVIRSYTYQFLQLYNDMSKEEQDELMNILNKKED